MSGKPAAAKDAASLSQAEKGQWRQIVDAVDALEQQIQALREEQKEHYKEAADAGYSPKRLREVIRERKRRRKHTRKTIDAAQMEFDLLWEASGGDDAVEGAYEERAPVMDRGGGRAFN